jgi:hypothetical protein
MSYYFAAILAFAGLLLLYNHRRQKRLDADPAQHHLASLLVGSVTGAPGASQRVAAEHLGRTAKGSADRRVRLTHAVMTVRRNSEPQIYSDVLDLARRLNG